MRFLLASLATIAAASAASAAISPDAGDALNAAPEARFQPLTEFRRQAGALPPTTGQTESRTFKPAQIRRIADTLRMAPEPARHTYADLVVAGPGPKNERSRDANHGGSHNGGRDRRHDRNDDGDHGGGNHGGANEHHGGGNPPPSAVPLLPAVWLMPAGLGALFGFARKRAGANPRLA